MARRRRRRDILGRVDGTAAAGAVLDRPSTRPTIRRGSPTARSTSTRSTTLPLSSATRSPLEAEVPMSLGHRLRQPDAVAARGRRHRRASARPSRPICRPAPELQLSRSICRTAQRHRPASSGSATTPAAPNGPFGLGWPLAAAAYPRVRRGAGPALRRRPTPRARGFRTRCVRTAGGAAARGRHRRLADHSTA